MAYFIRSCPLVSEDTKANYLSKQYLGCAAGNIKSGKIQDAFFRYLYEDLSKRETTAYAYRSAINKISKITGVDLWIDHNLDNVENIIQQFSSLSNDTVIRSLQKANHHKNLSCALKIYKKFLCSKNI